MVTGKSMTHIYLIVKVYSPALGCEPIYACTTRADADARIALLSKELSEAEKPVYDDYGLIEGVAFEVIKVPLSTP
jgi:hypothetical protein